MAERIDTTIEHPAWKVSLRIHHNGLRTGILVANVLPALRPWLTDAEYSNVDDKQDNCDRVDELVRILLTKDGSTFRGFCNAVEKNGYPHWANTLRGEGTVCPFCPILQSTVHFSCHLLITALYIIMIQCHLCMCNLTIIHRFSDFYVCLLPHNISALQGIGSRRSMQVEGLGGQVLRGVPFA